MASLFGDKGVNIDLSYDLRDARDWKVAVIREIEYLSGLTALAIEPTNGLFAAGTKRGKIFLYGSQATGHILAVPNSSPVKFLQFAALLYKLVCADEDGSLHIWDLSTLGRPKLVASHAYREPICSLSISPWHSHAFVGRRGTISCYDLLCHNRSPYMITDIWKAHELETVHRGMPAAPITGSSDLLDVIIHPRDLNLLFIAYAGGVVLYDLTQHKALSYYELIIPPGAPGGLGYNDPNVLQARRPALTSLSVHASGQLFVAGYLDGTIAFWAVSDEDRPLMVRTIMKTDINYPDGDELDRVLSNPTRLSPDELEELRLEPIFKLTWSFFGKETLSDPYSKDSLLTILGGTPPGNNVITCLRIPPLILPVPASPTSKHGVPADVHKSLEESMASTDFFNYRTAGVPIDYLLCPKDNPYFNNSFDPSLVMILHEWPANERSIEVREFPPPSLGLSKKDKPPPAADKDSDKPVDEEISAIIRDLRIEDSPSDYESALPTALFTGLRAANDGDMVHLSGEAYAKLRQKTRTSNSGSPPSLIGRAGSAWVDYSSHGQAEALSYTNDQPHRILLTHHRDLTIRIQDISAQLLIGSTSEPLSAPYPAPLTPLTISLSKLFSDTTFTDCKNPLLITNADIQSVRLTTETGECVVVMSSGHVILFGYAEKERRYSNLEAPNDDIVSLKHLGAEAGTFHPKFMIDNSWGAVTACGASDIGFVAVAYASDTLIIIDMRLPRIILRRQWGAKSSHRLTAAFHLKDAVDEKRIISLNWFVCGSNEDPQPRVRLLAARRSGTIHTFLLSEKSGRWVAEEENVKVDGVEHPLPKGLFALNAKDGRNRAASQHIFKEALVNTGSRSPVSSAYKASETHTFFVSAGEKGAKCTANLSGNRLGRVDWHKGKKIECAEVVFNKGAQALVAIMDDREAVAYSLPELEEIQTFQLTNRPDTIICLDDTGDFVDWSFNMETGAISGAVIGTFFAKRRVFDEPVIDYTIGRRAVPSLPVIVPLAPVSYLGSWFNFTKGTSGDDIDKLLAGPERPIPQDLSTSSVVQGQWQGQMQARAQALAEQASRTGNELYSNLSSAMADRGEVLSNLEDNVRALGDGGKRMLFEAKKLAAQQTGKRWFGL